MVDLHTETVTETFPPYSRALQAPPAGNEAADSPFGRGTWPRVAVRGECRGSVGGPRARSVRSGASETRARQIAAPAVVCAIARPAPPGEGLRRSNCEHGAAEGHALPIGSSGAASRREPNGRGYSCLRRRVLYARVGVAAKSAIMNGKKEKRGFFGLGRKSKADKPQYDGAMRDGKACGQVCSYMQSFSHLCYTPALPAACALAS